MRAASIQMPPAGRESDVLPGLPAAETPAYWRAQREGVALVCELRHRIGIAWDAPTYGAGGSENIAPWDHAFDELHAARRHPFAANLCVARSVTPTVAIVAALGAITAAAPVIAAGWGCRERDERGGRPRGLPRPDDGIWNGPFRTMLHCPTEAPPLAFITTQYPCMTLGTITTYYRARGKARGGLPQVGGPGTLRLAEQGGRGGVLPTAAARSIFVVRQPRSLF
ncbi:hypothetical protein [Muricoccus roseus]|uniref:hypothetical protein n=1 Tax=Muricoccus roseus TaxID=198092 RepID=UPI00111503C3|nr:hypothetical protein [Roseomonas rosea]